MASDTKNVKLGVCKISFGGVDLGYTQGGVDVTVKTDTHKVNVDQFGKTPINEYIMGRQVTVKCPLAETTLPNLVAIMPGSTLVVNGGVYATGTMTIVTNLTQGQTITIAGKTITFKAIPTSGLDEVLIGATVAATAANLAAFLSSVTVATDAALGLLNGSAAGAIVTITADNKGVAGNVAIATGTAGVSVTTSGATLTGGVDGAPARVDVVTGVGVNLLDVAQVLVLHPVNRAVGDFSEDFTVFKAATAGALQFAYKLENERIYSCEFSGYPDPVTSKLFALGDINVV
jgi:hypothetical protein